MINWYSKIAVSYIDYLLTSILLTLTSTLTHFSLYQNSMVISSVLDCKHVWTLTVEILNTICNRDCFADCSLDLTLTVSFWKTAFLACRWTHFQFSIQCSNGCQCVLRYFELSLFSIIYCYRTWLRGGGRRFFGDTVYTQCSLKGDDKMQ